MDIAKLDIDNMPHIGIFVALGKDFAIVPDILTEAEQKVIETILKVKCVKYSIAGSQMNGVMAKVFHNKVILSKICDKDDEAFFKKKGFEVLILDAYFAVGNLIFTDQKHVVLSKEFDAKTVKKIEEFLEVKAVQYQISDLPAIGSYLVANKNGFAVIPNAETKDIRKIETLLKVKGNIATINYGDSFIANGMLVNDHGIIVGRKTTGYELIRINDIFYN